jgi:GMP synthase (glutamine-hydrolysing)
MKLLIVNTCSNKLSEREFVIPFEYNNSRTNHYSELKDLRWADKILITGTALRDNEYLDNLDKFDWLKNVNKPVLGICSGAQIITSVFGGKIIKNQEIGMVDVNGNLFGKTKFQAYSLHQNGISNLVEFDILARSKNSIQAIKHKSKDIYGIIFHPEVRNEWVVEKFIEV